MSANVRRGLSFTVLDAFRTALLGRVVLVGVEVERERGAFGNPLWGEAVQRRSRTAPLRRGAARIVRLG